MNHWLIAPLLVPLTAAVALLFFTGRSPALRRTLSLGATAALLPLAILLVQLADTGAVLSYRLGGWPAPFGIVLVLDRLSALMLLVTAVLAPCSLLAAVRGEDYRGRHFHPLFQLQLVGLNGAFLTGDVFNLFVFFEILLIASFALALHGHGRERTRAGLHYTVVNLAGSSLFLVALGLLYAAAGTLNMADLAVRVGAAPADDLLLHTAALLLLVVFALKAAVLPLHLWLPGLYAHTSAAVAALFAIMTKVGLYAILRVFTLIFPGSTGAGEAVAGLLPWLALLTLAAGAVGVLGSRGLRLVIAWQVVLSAGMLLAGIGLGSVAGIGAALYYLVHTTLVTGGLFLLADLIAAQRATASDRLEPGPPVQQPTLLGGLFLVGAMAAAGTPPLSGFIGKVLLLRAAPAGGTAWLWAVVLTAGLVALVALSRAGSALFWKTEGLRAEGGGARPLAFAPVVVLLGAAVVLTVCAGPVIRYTEATAAQLLAPAGYTGAVLTREDRP